MTQDGERQPILDAEHLKLLTWFWYIRAGLAAMFLFFPAVYGITGFVLMAAAAVSGKQAEAPPVFVGVLFLVFAGIIALAVGAVAVLSYLTGRFIAARRHHTFCVVVAVLTCTSFPYGTILGLLTLLVLFREPVRLLFQEKRRSAESGE